MKKQQRGWIRNPISKQIIRIKKPLISNFLVQTHNGKFQVFNNFYVLPQRCANVQTAESITDKQNKCWDHRINDNLGLFSELSNRGVSAGWAIAHPVFARIEGTARLPLTPLSNMGPLSRLSAMFFLQIFIFLTENKWI